MKLSVPKVLQVFSLLVLVGAVALFVTVRGGYMQNQKSAELIGRSATSGIVAAQKLKVDLARLDACYARMLVTSQRAAAAQEYVEARKSVSQSLVAASKNIHFGVAETVPIKRILHVLPLYQTAVTQALAAVDQQDGSKGQIVSEPHRLMRDVLLPAADQLDEANTTALNDAYAEQVSANSRFDSQVMLAGGILAVFMLGVQFYLFRRFRRIVNPALAVATVLAVGFTFFSCQQFGRTHAELAAAKEDVFGRLHIIWRAEARIEQARASADLSRWAHATGDGAAAGYDKEVSESLARVLALPSNLSSSEFARQTAEDHASLEPTGYLAQMARSKTEVNDRPHLVGMISCTGEYCKLVGGDQAAVQKVSEKLFADLAAAKAANDSAFQQHSSEALAALSWLDVMALGFGVLVGGLAFAGIRQRQREYEV